MFTCTGSEANDLALRMARHHTGQRGVIVTAEAYHGNSDLTAGISPSLGEGSPLDPWVRRVPAPDSYRRPAPGLGAWLAGQVAAQIHDLERRGDGVAAFIADSLFSSDGIYTQPIDVLGPVAGVLVVPEVVAGFGRDTRYFNTFGGNTVAMAAAQVTLDVIRDEDLLASSGRVGAFLRAELTGLAARYPVIGDVRGSGLYLGV